MITERQFHDLVSRAESFADTLDRWGGIDGIVNRVAVIDDFIKKIDERQLLLVQLERLKEKAYVFKELLTVDEAAEYLGVHPKTIYKLVSSRGLTTTYRPPSTKMLILTDDLVNWCKGFPCESKGKTASVIEKGRTK